MKQDGQLRLAPIYDFAPMKADPEFIRRTFTWGAPFENGSQINYAMIVKQLSDYLDPDELMTTLANLADQLCQLPGLLEHFKCPKEIIEIKSLDFSTIRQRLKDYGVIA